MLAKYSFVIRGVTIGADFPVRGSLRLNVRDTPYLDMAVEFPERATLNGPVYLPYEFREPIAVNPGERYNVIVTFLDEHVIEKNSKLTVTLF